MSEVMPAFEAMAAKALAKANPEIIKAILDDGRIGIRVKDLYYASAAKDLKRGMKWELHQFDGL